MGGERGTVVDGKSDRYGKSDRFEATPKQIQALLVSILKLTPRPLGLPRV